jgi:hypothetical protein
MNIFSFIPQGFLVICHIFYFYWAFFQILELQKMFVSIDDVHLHDSGVFWNSIHLIILAFKARLCGGGKEIGQQLLGCLNFCSKSKEKTAEDKNDEMNAVSKDTGVM